METIHILPSPPRHYSLYLLNYEAKNWATCFFVGPCSTVRPSLPNIPTTSGVQVKQQIPPSCRSKGNPSFPLPCPCLAGGSPQGRAGGAGDTPGPHRGHLPPQGPTLPSHPHKVALLVFTVFMHSSTFPNAQGMIFNLQLLNPSLFYLKSGPSQTFNMGTCFVGLVFLPRSQQSPKQCPTDPQDCRLWSQCLVKAQP